MNFPQQGHATRTWVLYFSFEKNVGNRIVLVQSKLQFPKTIEKKRKKKLVGLSQVKPLSLFLLILSLYHHHHHHLQHTCNQTNA